MCGRYHAPGTPYGKDPPINLGEVFRRLRDMPELAENFNAAPTQSLPIYREDRKRGPELVALRWGLIPSWAKDASIGAKLINARAEGIAAKPAFRSALRARRCLVPMAGFYEWQKRPEGKLPHYIRVRDEPVFTAAGLYEWWRAPDGSVIETFCIVTGEPNAVAADVHDRAPAIIDIDDRDRWLDPGTPAEEAAALLTRPFPADRMTKHAVSSRVNRVANNDPGLVVPLDGTDDAPDDGR